MTDPANWALLAVATLTFLTTSFVLFRFAWRPLLRRHQAPPAPSGQALTVQRAQSLHHCPYCHDAVQEDGVACTSCLGRHHDDCWDTHGRCASCGHPERYAQVERTHEAPRRPRAPDAKA